MLLLFLLKVKIFFIDLPHDGLAILHVFHIQALFTGGSCDGFQDAPLFLEFFLGVLLRIIFILEVVLIIISRHSCHHGRIVFRSGQFFCSRWFQRGLVTCAFLLHHRLV